MMGGGATVDGRLLQPDRDVLDLGVVAPRSVSRGSVTLANRSDRPLKLTGTTTSCGCTVASVGRDQLGPDETTTLSFEFEAPEDLGQVRRFVTVNFVPSQRNELLVLELPLRATVRELD